MAFIETPLVQVLGSIAAILMGLPLLSLSLYYICSLINRSAVFPNRLAGALTALLVFVFVPLFTRPVPESLFLLMGYEAVKFLLWLGMISFLVLTRGLRHFLVSCAWSAAVGAVLVAASYPVLDLLGQARFHTVTAVSLATMAVLVVPFVVRTGKAEKPASGSGTEEREEKGNQVG